MVSRHSFSFEEYRDPGQTGFRAIRAINEDILKPGMGFPTHSHRDIEIITYLMEGTIEHQDSLGNRFLLSVGDVQRISCGSGLTHSEFNRCQQPARFLQIWIEPQQRGSVPTYELKRQITPTTGQEMKLIASASGSRGSITVNQNILLYACTLSPGKDIIHELRPGNHGWLQVTDGIIELEGEGELVEGDGAALSNEQRLRFSSKDGGHFLLFDLP
jgi:redox-sensitive bicupin YhaK (pirin superfamily)